MKKTNELRPLVEKIGALAEELQDDCHRCCSEIMKDNDRLTYQDATNLWMFTKLAELQHQITKLTKYKIHYGK